MFESDLVDGFLGNMRDRKLKCWIVTKDELLSCETRSWRRHFFFCGVKLTKAELHRLSLYLFSFSVHSFSNPVQVHVGFSFLLSVRCDLEMVVLWFGCLTIKINWCPTVSQLNPKWRDEWWSWETEGGDELWTVTPTAAIETETGCSRRVVTETDRIKMKYLNQFVTFYRF